jgi:hypothetical protein
VARGFATIRFSSLLPSPSSVRIYDASGRLIRSAICNQKSAMPLDLRALPAGAYLVKVEADGFSTTQKLVLQP